MNRFSIILLLACMMFSCGGGRRQTATRTAANASRTESTAPVLYTYRVTGTYPHSENDYTQGLFIHDGILYESTGTYGDSRLKSTDLQTGRKLNEISLPRRYFGEGAALLDGLIYQLTWREGIAMVYDAVSFEKRSEFRYKGEGWGLTTDGKMLYMSDGSNRIYVLDPESFATIRTIEVHMGSSPVKYLNELEWIGSRIWANVYTTDQAVIIDPENGNVTGIIDLRGLLGPSDITPATDVLNGIAYDAQTGKIFVTGKNWNKIFEIEIIEK